MFPSFKICEQCKHHTEKYEYMREADAFQHRMRHVFACKMVPPYAGHGTEKPKQFKYAYIYASIYDDEKLYPYEDFEIPEKCPYILEHVLCEDSQKFPR